MRVVVAKFYRELDCILQSISCPSEGKRIKGCMPRIVPNHSAFRKRNNPGNVGRKCSTFLELARVLVRCNHVALVIVNANHGTV
jgi:hypothetical protein